METNTNSAVNVDRISALPPLILHHILSFLSLEEVVPTSVLSKTWKQLCIYNVPQIVFYLKSLHVLDLGSCKLEPPRRTVTLSSLRRLCLSFVYVEDEVIRDMVAGCPLIEYMNIDNCRGFKSLELVGLHKLQEIKIIFSSNWT
ncbi:hypothetical protein CUMW_219380 [Citrus unshiu]|uniref:F-box domain-containing protein n=1 Tax=Citrus unshiu TaxID=55188 RepID=A0A2H5QDB2_CITUN|nr:hypothetical protein CUMW_219380 [Citrus unshiu]